MAPTSELYEQWRQQQTQNIAFQQQYDQYWAAQAEYQQLIQDRPPSGIKVPEPPTYIEIPIPEIPPMKPLKFIIFYALVAFSTFTWQYNHTEWENKLDRVPGSVLSAVAWPIYWSGRLVFAADDAITAAVPRVVEWWNAPAPDTSLVCTNEATGEIVRANKYGLCVFREKHSEGTGAFVTQRPVINTTTLYPTITGQCYMSKPGIQYVWPSIDGTCTTPDWAIFPHD